MLHSLSSNICVLCNAGELDDAQLPSKKTFLPKTISFFDTQREIFESYLQVHTYAFMFLYACWLQLNNSFIFVSTSFIFMMVTAGCMSFCSPQLRNDRVVTWWQNRQDNMVMWTTFRSDGSMTLLTGHQACEQHASQIPKVCFWQTWRKNCRLVKH